MKSLLKKFCVLFAAVVTASFCRFSCVSASSLPIDETIFPDMYFREYILKTIDTNKDCELSEQEIAAVDTIHTGWVEGTRETPKAVKNFQGIEYFTELKTLWIQNMHHAEPDSYEQSDEGIDIWLDVSKNIKLRTIECEAGKIDKLDLSVLPDLRWIRVDAIDCPAQDLSGNTGLISIEWHIRTDYRTDVAAENKLKLPSSLPALEIARLENVDFSNLNLKTSRKLAQLYLKNVNRKTLKLDGLKYLREFSYQGGDNCASTIQIVNCPNVSTLCLSRIYKAEKINIALATMKKLRKLEYGNCKFPFRILDVRKNKKLRFLRCNNTNIKKIVFPKNPSYRKIDVARNQLTKLDIRKIRVKEVYCGNNKIRELLVKGNEKINILDCGNNRLKKLVLTGCKNLRRLVAKGNMKSFKKIRR